MKTKLALACCAVVLFAVKVVSAEETDAAEIIKKTMAAYANLQTYSSQCTVTWSATISGRPIVDTRTMSIKMKKTPNQYLIKWQNKTTAPTPRAGGSGAIWNDGDQPCCLWADYKLWTKFKADGWAIQTFSGHAGRAEFIPILFLSTPTLENSYFSSLVDPQLFKSEKIDGEECYVIGHKSTLFQKETFWISKSTLLIRKHSCSFKAGKELIWREFGNLMDTEFLKREPLLDRNDRSQEVNEAARRSQGMSTATAVYSKIETPKFTNADFAFKIPSGTSYHEFPPMLGGVPE